MPALILVISLCHLLSVCSLLPFPFSVDFSALCDLQVVYVDSNVGIHSIPASLTGIETIGLHDCNVAFSKRAGGGGGGLDGAYQLLGPQDMIAPLTELSARAVHSLLKSEIVCY